ncbi:MAG: serine hydrolase [Planctomycetes bacterium]|nr:serine hydrolase [Planctomycetota bacterium]
MEQLQKPIVSFLPAKNRDDQAQGADQIALHDALMMRSGLRFPKNNLLKAGKLSGSEIVDFFFRSSKEVPKEGKKYQYWGYDPQMIMEVVDICTPGSIQDFIDRELFSKLGITEYTWAKEVNGAPKCGAGCYLKSRDILKVGIMLLQEGVYNEEQLISPKYLKNVYDMKVRSTESQTFRYFFHGHSHDVSGKSIVRVGGIGAGGQYMSTFPELNVVIVATSLRKVGRLTEQLYLNTILPLFIQE